MSLCTSGVRLQVLPFTDNQHLGSIPGFQRFSCFDCFLEVLGSLAKEVWRLPNHSDSCSVTLQ